MKKNKCRVFFWGTPELACPSLRALDQDPFVEIVGVGVMPDKKRGRKQILTPCAVKECALELGLPIYEIQNKQELIGAVEHVSFDLGIVIAFGMIFPSEVLEKTDLGIVNIHFSLLPQYRGASPVQSALLYGDTKSGITWQRMVPELDAGDILFQKSYSIEGKSTSELFEYFGEQTAFHMDSFIESYVFEKSLTPLSQNNVEATFCGKFSKMDGLINPSNQTASEIYQRYLAFDVWPGIFIETSFGNVKLKKISLQKKEGLFKLSCSNNTSLWLEVVQVPGKNPLPVQDVLRGYPDLFAVS